MAGFVTALHIYKRALELMRRPAGAPRLPRLRLEGREEEQLRGILFQMSLLPPECGVGPAVASAS